jgi:hypothetical protein
MKTFEIIIQVFLVVITLVSRTICQTDWDNKYLRATGIGYANPYLPVEQHKESAIEAAKRIALRNLYDKVKSLQLNSGDTIGFIISQNDSLRDTIDEVVRHFDIIYIREVSYNAVEIKVEIYLRNIVEAVYGPEEYYLYQNYPNPFNSSTTIRYVIWYDDYVTIDIYSVLGQRVRQLVKKYQYAGDNSVIWDGKNDSGNYLSSGFYFYILIVGEREISVNKALLIK